MRPSWTPFLKQLEKVDPASLNRDEQMAFYINVYNAWTIKLILTRYPDIESIKDLGGLFFQPLEKRACAHRGQGADPGQH